MTVIDPNTGLMITCQPWEYAELCRQHGWIKTTYETSTTPVQKRSFTPPEEKAELEWAKKAKEEEPKECVEVEVTTREYDHAEAIKRATENLCGEEEI